MEIPQLVHLKGQEKSVQLNAGLKISEHFFKAQTLFSCLNLFEVGNLAENYF